MALSRTSSMISTTSKASVPSMAMDSNISQITPYLFVAGEDSARQFSAIFSNGIACVINVANELPQMIFPPYSGIESLKYPIRDNPAFPVSSYFDLVADRIAANVAANRRTLLYCHYGRSRSVTFTLAYLIKHHHLPLQTAFDLVKQRRQLAAPNVGFWSQLRSYESHQQQILMTAMFRNFQDSLHHGQHAVYQLTDHVGRVIGQFSFVNPYFKTGQTIKQHPHVYRHPLRLRPMIYARPSHLRRPLRMGRPYLL